MLESTFKRELGDIPVAPKYTLYQTFILQILAITFTSVSVVSATLTVYWFIMMRRNFRHHLIMILIVSDLFKASWFMIYGIASLLPGSIESASTFCQVSGFFMKSGIELSDFTVLVMAIHSALYIFKPPTTPGEGGLYPYRYFAYALLIALPLLMAGLAFINSDGAYVSEGTSCHLPVRPFWYRLALSWIPRYLIFLAILGIDTAIYFYIRCKFAGLPNGPKSSHLRTRSHDSAKQQQQKKASRRFSLPPTPPLAYNGLMPETRTTSMIFSEGHDNSISNKPQDWRTKIAGGFSVLKWTKPRIRFKVPMTVVWSKMPLSKHTGNTNVLVTANSASEAPLVSSSPELLPPILAKPSSISTSWTTFVTRFNSRPASKTDVLSFLRSHQQNSFDSSNVSARLSQHEFVSSCQENLNQLYLIETRNKIRKQQRFLFIYPVAYMAMWIIPFIQHTLQYNDYYAANPPFTLDALMTIVITVQGAVDCWIFNVKEKPWRLAAKDRRGLCGGLEFLRNLKSDGALLTRFRSSGGKSKAAMAADATFAYRRRDEEIAATASEMSNRRRSERRERSWWDEPEDSDEDFSPLVESPAPSVDRHAGGASGPQEIGIEGYGASYESNKKSTTSVGDTL